MPIVSVLTDFEDQRDKLTSYEEADASLWALKPDFETLAIHERPWLKRVPAHTVAMTLA